MKRIFLTMLVSACFTGLAMAQEPSSKKASTVRKTKSSSTTKLMDQLAKDQKKIEAAKAKALSATTPKATATSKAKLAAEVVE